MARETRMMLMAERAGPRSAVDCGIEDQDVPGVPAPRDTAEGERGGGREEVGGGVKAVMVTTTSVFDGAAAEERTLGQNVRDQVWTSGWDGVSGLEVLDFAAGYTLEI